MRFDTCSFKSVRVWLWLAIAGLALGGFLELTYELHRKDAKIAGIDRSILLFISDFRTPILNGVAVDLTAMGSPVVIAVFGFILLIVLILLKDRLGIIHLVSVVIGASLWSAILKNWVERERPQIVPRLVEVAGFAYPSGHSLAASSLYLTFWILICRSFTRFKDRAILGLMSLSLIASVALSRVYLGVHYPTDVLGGVCLGAAWAFFVTGVMSIRPRRA